MNDASGLIGVADTGTLTGIADTGKSIAIAGTGRVARTLGRFLCDAGEPVTYVFGRNLARTQEAAAFIGRQVRPVLYCNLPADLSHLVIAVSDAAVMPVAGAIAERASPRIALHTCGAAGPGVLHTLQSQGTACGTLHPLQTLTGDENSVRALHGASFGMCGDAAALDWARHIVALAEGTALSLDSARMPLYHAAAVMASNSVLALVDASHQLLQLAGIESQTALGAIAPLLRESIDNSLRLGPVAALTGPVARGDLDTIAAHRRALEAAPQSVRKLYLAGALQAVDMARRKGLPFDEAAQLEECLES